MSIFRQISKVFHRIKVSYFFSIVGFLDIFINKESLCGLLLDNAVFLLDNSEVLMKRKYLLPQSEQHGKV